MGTAKNLNGCTPELNYQLLRVVYRNELGQIASFAEYQAIARATAIDRECAGICCACCSGWLQIRRYSNTAKFFVFVVYCSFNDQLAIGKIRDAQRKQERYEF